MHVGHISEYELLTVYEFPMICKAVSICMSPLMHIVLSVLYPYCTVFKELLFCLVSVPVSPSCMRPLLYLRCTGGVSFVTFYEIQTAPRCLEYKMLNPKFDIFRP